MEWIVLVLTILLFAAAFIATSLSLIVLQRPRRAWSRPFCLLMIAVTIWSLGYALEVNLAASEAKVMWAKVQYLGIVAVPVAWLFFSLAYTGRAPLLRRQYYLLVSMIPVATIGIAFTNEAHSLMWRKVIAATTTGGFSLLSFDHGPWFWLHVGYSYILLFAGTVAFVASFNRFGTAYRRQTLALLAAPALPWLANLLYLSGWDPLVAIDLTPVAFALAGLIFVWAIVQYDLLNVVPIAHSAIVDSIADAVLVVDSSGRIIYVNAAATSLLNSDSSELLGIEINAALPFWAELAANKKTWLAHEVSLPIGQMDMHFDMTVSSLADSRQRTIGRTIVLRDVTERKATESALRQRQQLFENLVAVARATSEGPSLQDTLQSALDVTAALTRAEYGSLFLLDAVGRVTHSILARGKAASGREKQILGTVMHRGLAGWVLRHREPALIPDTDEDDRWVTLPDQPYVARSVLSVPITTGPEAPGILTLQHSQPNHFTVDDLELIKAASDQMALALSSAHLYDEQRRLAERQLILYKTMRTIGSHLEPETVVQIAAQTIRELTSWEAVAILRPVGSRNRLAVEAVAGNPSLNSGNAHGIGSDLPRRAYATGRTQVAVDGEDRDDGLSPDSPYKAIFVPLRHGRERLGVLSVESADSLAFSEEDVRLAESLAEVIGLAMANARLFGTVSEQNSRLQALIASSRDGIVLVGLDGKILVVNRPALDYLGLGGEPEDWVYRRLSEGFAENNLTVPELDRYLDTTSAFLGAEMPEEEEGEFEVSGKTIRWLNAAVTSAGRDAAGPVGRLLVLQDVTRERTLQQLRDDLTHTMVHDLRNPLNVVSGSLEMLDQKVSQLGAADAEMMVAIATQSTTRMLRLVNSILNISRLESGKIPLQRVEAELDELVQRVLAEQGPLAADKNLSLKFESPEAGGTCLVDCDLIERVVQNLIGNAIKFTPPGGEILVTLEHAPDSIMLAVQDSGPGISDDLKDQLFEKFVTGRHKEKGSGLGLAFCRMAVEAHGGEIWAASRPGDGAAFYVVLPSHKQSDGSVELPAALADLQMAETGD